MVIITVYTQRIITIARESFPAQRKLNLAYILHVHKQYLCVEEVFLNISKKTEDVEY